MTAGIEVGKLIDGILADVKRSGTKEPGSWRHPDRDVHCLARRDYAPSLRKLLDQADVDDILRSARGILPNLNRDHDPVRIERWLKGSPSSGLQVLFAHLMNCLDVDFQGSPFTGPEGLALRGFFVNRDDQMLRRPLIYVNTAHHPVAAAAALFHEVGHLVAAEVFDQRRQPVHLFLDADYNSHLNDVEELTVDIVLSLVAYPAPIARKIFGSQLKWGGLAKKAPLGDEVFSQVSEHSRAHFGVSLQAGKIRKIPPRRKLNYLAGMIHFAKLRSTLLVEYGV